MYIKNLSRDEFFILESETHKNNTAFQGSDSVTVLDVTSVNNKYRCINSPTRFKLLKIIKFNKIKTLLINIIYLL